MANIDLTLRRVKGVHLTIDEVDANFTNLKNAVIQEEQARISAIENTQTSISEDIDLERDQRIAQDNFLLDLVQDEEAARIALNTKVDSSVDTYKTFAQGSASPAPQQFRDNTISGFDAYNSTDFPSEYFNGITINGSESVRSTQLAFNWNSEENAPSGMFFRTNDDSGTTSTWSSWTKIWNENNDGAGSGLDADTLDGIQADGFAKVDGTGAYGSWNISVTNADTVDGLHASHFAPATEVVHDVTGTALTLSISNGTIKTWTLGENSTVTDSLLSGQYIVVRLLNGSSYSIVWPSGIKWTSNLGNVAPILSSANTLVFWKIHTTLFGALVGSDE